MNFKYRDELPEEFDSSSRVWIYQSNRPFTLQEAFQLEDMMKTFVDSWNSHGVPVKGYANLFFGQFIVLMADEKASKVSGCSTDSSVRLIREMESRFNVLLFDRQLLAFYMNDRVQLLPLSQLAYGITNGHIQPGTLYFNNTVQSKAELETQWIIQVKESWLARKTNFPAAV